MTSNEENTTPDTTPDTDDTRSEEEVAQMGGIRIISLDDLLKEEGLESEMEMSGEISLEQGQAMFDMLQTAFSGGSLVPSDEGRIKSIVVMIQVFDAGVDHMATGIALTDPTKNNSAAQMKVRLDMVQGLQAAFTMLGVSDEEFNRALFRVESSGTMSYNSDARIAMFPLPDVPTAPAEVSEEDVRSDHNPNTCPVCQKFTTYYAERDNAQKEGSGE